MHAVFTFGMPATTAPAGLAFSHTDVAADRVAYKKGGAL